jgi:penicillin-binding protein 1A
MNTIRRKFASLFVLATAFSLALAAVVVGGYYYVEPSLPQAAELRDIEIQIPLSVYSRDGRLIAQFGEQKRNPVAFDEIPDLVVRAFLAAEDDSFFEHPGIDYAGIARAVVSYIAAGGERVPGASTITQQVARQNFLSRDFSLVRKFREWILAMRIEQEFSKEEILELFLNTTFLGQRSYGIAAAARTYFDKDLANLTLSDAAIIAGIPRGPSILNPVSDPIAARDRRAYVLRRMNELGWITQAEHDEASAVPVIPTLYGARIEANAPYVAEMVRAEMLNRYGPDAYTSGLKVVATVDSRLQAASNAAIQEALLAYDERHGYRGPLGHIELPEGDIDPQTLDDLLGDYPGLLEYETGIVLAVEPEMAVLFAPGRGAVQMPFAGMAWAERYISDSQTGPRPTVVGDVLSRGDVIRFRADADGGLRLAQIPDVQGALVALDPRDGAVVALNGGFDFNLDNFNRATQALRQPGSSFKPFTFSAALEHGFTVARIVNDTPLTLEESEQEEDWRPANHGGGFAGPIPLRRVLEQSINVAAIRVVMEVGIDNVIRHVRKFGFGERATPRNLAISLGAGSVAPLELATGYATFANGGFKIEPYFIERIEDSEGKLIFVAEPKYACPECPVDSVEPQRPSGPRLAASQYELYPDSRLAERVISPQNAYLVTDMMQGVIRRGTGRRALALGRSDLAGKTGTTDEERDTWFAGFNADLVAVSWVGFNQARPLGRGEEGARTALPMWISFMGNALEGAPQHLLPQPPGIVEVRINPENGLLASAGNPRAVFEKFRIGHEPPPETEAYSGRDLIDAVPGETQHRSGEPIF